MKRRIAIAALTALIALLPAAMRAQSTPTPAPTPSDVHVYEDAAMHFKAPDNMVLLGRRVIPLKALGTQLQNVGVWRTQPGKGRDWVITLAVESYEGTLDGWDTSFENELREQIDGVFVRGKTHSALQNGMPALFMDISFGEGFTSRKEFAYLWSDGQRGIALTIAGRLGDIDAEDAKKALADASAVLYPIEREQ
jgi:hypothetical protein